MANTSIKELIIQKIIAKLETITGGIYNSHFTSVKRAIPIIKPGEITIWTPYYEVENDLYSCQNFEQRFRIEAMRSVAKDELPDVIANEMEADLQECLFGEAWRLIFSSGSVNIGVDPDDLRGKVFLKGLAVMTIEDFNVTSGDWFVGNAAGTMVVKRKAGGDYIVTPAPISVAGIGSFVGGTLTPIKYVYDIFNPVFVDELRYMGSGVTNYPEIDDTAVSVAMDIVVRYRTYPGNPYRTYREYE